MVRSPAAASRKRRIESSSEELEEVASRSPRKSKLRKVSVPSPDSSGQGLLGAPAAEEEQPALENDGSGASTSSSNASQEGNEGEDEEDAEYQEKLQIWEMFADEYHDSEYALLLFDSIHSLVASLLQSI